MSADALCADLHGDGGSVSSVRVEVSRLRKLLGPWIDTDRYRLTCDVETDVRRIEGLLAGGAVREAAEAYAGPLLPSSEAPGVVRERERLDTWLRQAVMTADDTEALWAWVHTRTGEDDLGAWKRLLTQLEFRDPRRSLCAAAGRRAASCSADVTPGWSTGSWKFDPAGRRDRGDAGDEVTPWAEHRSRRAQRHVAAGPRPRRRPRGRGRARRSARASRPPTTCSPACATRGSPSGCPAASTTSRPASARRSPRSPTATTSPAWSTTCSPARTSAPTWPCCAATTCGSCSSAACRACRSCRA